MVIFSHGRSILHNIRVVSKPDKYRRRAREFSQLKTLSETISVPCPGSGTIPLDIYYPNTVSARNSRPAVVIFFPRGPLFSDTTQDANNISVLRTTLHCPVVQINYRFDAQHKFPTPIYDMMAGYDWVQRNLLPKRSFIRAGRSDHFGVIATCGELVGGQLATVLALTECRVGEPGVVAAAVNNPVVDWVSLGETNDIGNSEAERLSLANVLRKRDQLFQKPEGYFDPFASPIHFFRTAGVSVPLAAIEKTPLNDMDELALSERQDIYTRSSIPSSQSGVRDQEVEPEAVKPPRRVSLRYPSVAFRLKLPEFQLTAGKQSPMSAQVKDFARHLQRSLRRQSKDERDVDDAPSNGSPYFHHSPGFGLWDNSNAGRTKMLETAQWVAKNVEI